MKTEKIPQLPSKAPFSKRFEDAVGEACESAAARRVAKQFGLAASTVRSIDCAIWSGGPRSGASRRCGKWGWMRSTLGKKQKFLTVVSNLESAEPVWFGRERKKETLDGFFRERTELTATARYRSGVRGHVGTLPAKHRTMGAGVPHRL